jgi:hypothetical protein
VHPLAASEEASSPVSVASSPVVGANAVEEEGGGGIILGTSTSKTENNFGSICQSSSNSIYSATVGFYGWIHILLIRRKWHLPDVVVAVVSTSTTVHGGASQAVVSVRRWLLFSSAPSMLTSRDDVVDVASPIYYS